MMDMSALKLQWLPLALVCLSASAQDQWAIVVQAVAGVRSPDSFVLVATDPGFGFQWFGEDALGATNGKELILMAPARNVADTLVRDHGWQCWALFDPSGQMLDEGRGLPRPAAIRERMLQAGWRPLREALKAHLHDHPEDGQGWLELAFDVARQARTAKEVGTLSATLLQSIREELLPCLRALREIPGTAETWGDPGNALFRSLFRAIWIAELDQDPEIGDAIHRLADKFPDLIAVDPEKEILWHARSYMLRSSTEQDQDAAIRFALSLEGVPGRPWPPPFYAFWMRNWYRKDPETMVRKGSELLEHNLEPTMVRRLGKPHVYQMLKAWGGLHLEGLLLQKRIAEALSYMGWLRSQAGNQWVDLSNGLRGNLVPTEEDKKGNFDPKPMPLFTTEERGLLQNALAEAPLPSPTLPKVVPLRLAPIEIHEPADWSLPDWLLLQKSPVFETWDTSELIWTPLRHEEVQSLLSSHDWQDGPRWVLLQGEELLATGPGIPNAEKLEDSLRAQARPRLDILSDFIKTHPDRLDARRERMEFLRPRLPNPRLESLFLQDCEALNSPIGSLPFQPEAGLWGPAAKRICTRLAEKLQSWPFSADDWRAYAEWSGLDSRSPRPAMLLSDLDSWPCQAFARLPGPIPGKASLEVMRSLLSTGRPEEADAWAQVLWEKGLKDWLVQWEKLAPRSSKDKDEKGHVKKGQVEGPYDYRASEVNGILAYWGKALIAERNAKRVATVKQGLEDIHPRLAEMISGIAK